MADSKISALSDGTTPAGTDKFVVARGGANNSLTWTEMLAAMPGAEIGYDQITSSVNIASTTESSGTTVLTAAAHTFDGSPVIAEFFAPFIASPGGAAGFVIACLFEGATEIGRLVQVYTGGTTSIGLSAIGKLRFTPTAASHTYKIMGFYTGSGTGMVIGGGAGGTADVVAAYLRFTKV